MKPKVSIIIRAYNEEKHIGKLMDGISQQSGDAFRELEVLLVDSGSTDKTREIAKGKGARIVHIKKEEFSFGRALNIGCKAAGGDVLLLSLIHI